jgi:hypothetical protein
MRTCIGQLKANIGVFIDSLAAADANQGTRLKDWRARVVGYRDIATDSNWLIDQPFVRDAGALRTQLSALEAEGGGDEPESLLDAIYRVISVESTEKGAAEDPGRWRHRREAIRMLIVFTDASFTPVMRVPEANGGTVADIVNLLGSSKVLMTIFAPNFPCFDELARAQGSEYNVVGPEGADPQQALAEFTKDQANFRRALEQLARTVSKSASVEVL